MGETLISMLLMTLCCVSDHQRHPAGVHGGSVDPGGHAGSHCVESH